MALVKSLSVLPTLEDDLSRLEQILVDSVVAENDYLTEIASHLITAGGKRFVLVLRLQRVVWKQQLLKTYHDQSSWGSCR